MLAKHWKLYLVNASDKDLDFDAGGRVNISYQGWGIDSGSKAYGADTTDNFVFTTSDVLVAGGAGLSGAPVDNSIDNFFGINGTIELAIDDVTSAGFYELYLEEAANAVDEWVTDSLEFVAHPEDRLGDLTLIKSLNSAITTAENTIRINFEIN